MCFTSTEEEPHVFCNYINHADPTLRFTMKSREKLASDTDWNVNSDARSPEEMLANIPCAQFEGLEGECNKGSDSDVKAGEMKARFVQRGNKDLLWIQRSTSLVP